MAPIRRFSVAENEKNPSEEQGPLPPKKRLSRPRDASERPEVTRPWYERPPPGFPLPLYAQAQGFGEGGIAPRQTSHGRGGQAEVARAAGPRTHAEGSSREFVVWAAMAPRMWI
nr:proline-rich protein 3-like [Aegilops tauschii subsp. strangulata]